MDYPIHFADQLKQHLRALRKSRGLTQAQLAQRLGVVQSRIADIEANPASVSIEQWFRLLAALDVQCVLRDKKPEVSLPKNSPGSELQEPKTPDNYLPPINKVEW